MCGSCHQACVATAWLATWAGFSVWPSAGTALYLGHQTTHWGTRALGFGVYVGDCVVVCLFAVVGGMLCKSDKPSIIIIIIIITALYLGHQTTPWGTRALGFGVYVGDCVVVCFFVCLPWSEVCSARVTSLLLLLLLRCIRVIRQHLGVRGH